MSFPANTPSLDDLPRLASQEIALLPVELLAILQREIDERLKRDKAVKARLDTALSIRYASRAAEERKAAGRDTGTVRFDDGDFTIVADLPKRVDWDQEKLARIAAEIVASGENPAAYIETTLKVSERRYADLPAARRVQFEPARTVGSGQPGFRLEAGTRS